MSVNPLPDRKRRWPGHTRAYDEYGYRKGVVSRRQGKCGPESQGTRPRYEKNGIALKPPKWRGYKNSYEDKELEMAVSK